MSDSLMQPLSALVGKVVESVAHDPGERVTLKFSDGTSVSARLMPGQPDNNKLCVHVVRFKE